MLHSNWIDTINQFETIYVFGARESSQATIKRIFEWSGKQISGLIVSNKNENPSVFCEKTVYEMKEFNDKQKKEMLVVIAQCWENSERIKDMLIKNGFSNIIESPEQNRLASSFEIADLERKYSNENMEYSTKLLDESTISIYAVTSHLNCHNHNVKKYSSKFVKYIQAGAALTDLQICDIRDSVGDNISEKNPFYCELTAGYWIAKNDLFSDYVGLFHYSRGLDLGDRFPHLLEENNLILPCPMIMRHEIITRFAKQDYEIMREAVMLVSPEYIEALETYFLQHQFFIGNMLICERKIFVALYEWMFKVIDACEKIYNKKKICIAKRIWGYYSEHLLNIYFTQNRKLNVAFLPIVAMYDGK